MTFVAIFLFKHTDFKIELQAAMLQTKQQKCSKQAEFQSVEFTIAGLDVRLFFLPVVTMISCFYPIQQKLSGRRRMKLLLFVVFPLNKRTEIARFFKRFLSGERNTVNKIYTSRERWPPHGRFGHSKVQHDFSLQSGVVQYCTSPKRTHLGGILTSAELGKWEN